MLCTINPSVGSHADNGRARAYNVLCSIHAIATAAAGASPVVNPVNSSGTRNTNHNCITVLGNTEAGGWLAGTSNHYTASSTYSNSSGTTYLDLYRDSGKSSFPWYRTVMWSPYAYNSSFDSHPNWNYLNGCTTSNPTTTAFTSTENGFYGWPNSGSYSNNPSAVTPNHAATYNEHFMRLEEASRTYTCAVTSNYIILIGPDFLYYFGIRTVGGWELNRTDNPPWVHFFYTRRDSWNGITSTNQSNNQYHTDRCAAWGSTINSAGTQYAAALYGQRSDYGSGAYCSLTGMNGWIYRMPIANGPYLQYRSIRNPLFQSDLNSNWGQYTNNYPSYFYLNDGVVADTTTGLSVPPVYPVVFNLVDGNFGSASIGTAPGIFKGMHGHTAHINNFVTGASYTIGGETYYPIRTGNVTYIDLWFVRAA
jgi:hypothetical protein